MAVAGIAHRYGIDVDDLRDLVQRPGPFLTVHLRTDGAVENAATRSARRWKALRQRLQADGASDAVLDAVDPLVEDAHHAGEVLVVVATEAGTHLVTHLDVALEQDDGDDRATWGPLPDLVPLLRWRQSRPPHLLVWADRGGADLRAAGFGAPDLARQVGDGDPQRKVQAGGWSQARYQRRADDDWAHTAAEVADAVARLADRVEPRLVVLGGDVVATGLVRERLPERLVDRVRVIEHGRAADGGEAERDEEVRRLVATAVAEDTVAVLDTLREELGQHDRAVTGADATVDALDQSAVALLLVADAGEGDHAAPLVRAALATGAALRIVPHAGPLADGVGALLRWPTNPDQPT